MKIELILFLFLSLSMTTFGFTREEARSHWDECLREQKYTREQFEDFKKRRTFEFDCFNACVMKKRGNIIRGKIDPEKLASNLKEMGLLTPMRTEDRVRRCAFNANREPNECSAVKNMLDCFFIK